MTANSSEYLLCVKSTNVGERQNIITPFIFLEVICLGILSATDKSNNKEKKKERKKLISQLK